MAFRLRMVMVLCLALALIVSPFGATTASACPDAGRSTDMVMSMAMTPAHLHHHDAQSDGSTGHRSGAPGAILHACCTGLCFGPAESRVETVPVVLGAVAVAWPVDTALPEGLNTAPPFDPPRSTI